MNIRIIFAACIALKSCILILLLVSIFSCKKETAQSSLRYYEVGYNGVATDWRDSSFIVATSNASLIAEVETQLTLPVAQRKIVTGKLINGNGGYNKNVSHSFKWRFKENNWGLTELSAEIYDGRPYSDVDNGINYWLNTMGRFAPWGSYIKKEVTGQ